MDTFTIFLLAIGLAMDAFVVSVSCGLNEPHQLFKEAALAGVTFGFFQAGMTVLGWALGLTFSFWISAYSGYVSLILLSFIGAKMIYEAFVDEPKIISLTSIVYLVTLAIATSIDALAAGVSLASLNISIVFPASIIGLLTLFVSFTGVYLGCKVTEIVNLNKPMNILGGIILISLGVKIFLE